MVEGESPLDDMVHRYGNVFPVACSKLFCDTLKFSQFGGIEWVRIAEYLMNSKDIKGLFKNSTKIIGKLVDLWPDSANIVCMYLIYAETRFPWVFYGFLKHGGMKKAVENCDFGTISKLLHPLSLNFPILSREPNFESDFMKISALLIKNGDEEAIRHVILSFHSIIGLNDEICLQIYQLVLSNLNTIPSSCVEITLDLVFMSESIQESDLFVILQSIRRIGDNKGILIESLKYMKVLHEIDNEFGYSEAFEKIISSIKYIDTFDYKSKMTSVSNLSAFISRLDLATVCSLPLESVVDVIGNELTQDENEDIDLYLEALIHISHAIPTFQMKNLSSNYMIQIQDLSSSQSKHISELAGILLQRIGE